MNRPRRRRLQENLVKTAISVLEKVDRENGRSRHLERLHIHKQINNKYHKMFIKIIDYLEELRGNNKNPIGDMLKDYFTCIYKVYSWNKSPQLLNFSPSPNNQLHLEEFIYEFTEQNQEEYWIKEIPKPPEIIDMPIIPEDNDFMPSFIEV